MLGDGGAPCGVSTSLNNRHGIFPRDAFLRYGGWGSLRLWNGGLLDGMWYNLIV